MSLSICPKCDAEALVGARYCAVCGTRLTPDASPQIPAGKTFAGQGRSSSGLGSILGFLGYGLGVLFVLAGLIANRSLVILGLDIIAILILITNARGLRTRLLPHRRQQLVVWAVLATIGVVSFATMGSSAPPPTAVSTATSTAAPNASATAEVAPTSPPPNPTAAVARVAPTQVPTPQPAAAVAPLPPTPATVPPPTRVLVPEYQILGIKQTSTPNRPRFSMDIVLKPGSEDARLLTTEEKAYRTAALVDAVENAFRQKPEAKAVVVFAFSTAAAAGTGFDIARAVASTDGLGWTGDKSWAGFGPTGVTDAPKKVVLTFTVGPDDVGGQQFAEAIRP